MVEVNPRPHKPNLFVQVSVAVISGAAAMYCIQSFHPAVNSPASAAPKVSPAETAAPSAAPALDAAAESPRFFKAAPPAAVSMLIMPEPGGAAGGVVSVGDDEAGPAGTAPSTAKRPEPAAVAPRKETPVIHLQHSGLSNRYAGSVGHDFQSTRLSPHAFAKKEAPKTELAPREIPPAPEPHFIAVPRNLDEKGIPQKDIFVPSTLHPEIVEDQPFWDYELKRRAAVAGLIALAGILYLMFVHGLFDALVARPRGDS